jgi:hypothetical protein
MTTPSTDYPMSIRTYSELIRLKTFDERFEYLKLGGLVGEETFGFDRHVNQMFYRSAQWKRTRRDVIVRDSACDLAMQGHEIRGVVLIHHMNPITLDQIRYGIEDVLDPKYLITTTHATHNAIHYGDERQLPRPFVPRRPGDTKLW